MVAWHQTEYSVLRQKPVYLMFNLFIHDIKANFSQCTKWGLKTFSKPTDSSTNLEAGTSKWTLIPLFHRGCSGAGSKPVPQFFLFSLAKNWPLAQIPVPGWPQFSARLEWRTAYIRGWGWGLTRVCKIYQNIITDCKCHSTRARHAAEIRFPWRVVTPGAILAVTRHSPPLLLLLLLLWEHRHGRKQP